MSDNSLPASKRKIDKAMRQGRVARSPELVADLVLLWGLFVLSLVSGGGVYALRWFRGMLTAGFEAAQAPRMEPAVLALVARGLGPVLALVALIAAGALALSLAVHQIVSGGIRISWDAVLPRFDRIDPSAGMARLFNGGAWGSAGISLLKMAAALGCLALMVPKAAAGLLGLEQAPLPALPKLMQGQLLSIGYAIAGLSAVLAVAQAFWARKRWSEQLKMSHQEAVEDAKESEGDPRTRRRFRMAHRKLARRRTMQAVAASDVVLANPTHVAVALRYRRGRMRAPRVMAKGADLMALNIKEAARALGIPVIEQPPLARDLYASVAVGREIPTRLYRAVARIIHQIRGLQRPRSLAA